MPNMPKPNPYGSSKIKKPSSKKPPTTSRGLGMGSAVKKALPTDKLKAVLGLLLKGAGAPRGESPMPYTRLGSNMDLD